MRTIDSSIITAIQTGQIKPFICIEITLTGAGHTYRYTTCDAPIYISGNKYSPRDMEPSNISYSIGQIVDQATISIDNNDDALTSDFVGNDVQGEAIQISVVFLDSTNQIINAPVTLFVGELDEWNLSEGVLEINITNQFSQWNKITFSQYQSSCRWKVFKGTECGYSGGDTTCNRSYADCSSKSNTANFGGFRWLPSIENRAIHWGMAGPGGVTDFVIKAYRSFTSQ